MSYYGTDCPSWYQEGDALLSSLAAFPATPDAAAFWRIGQCGLFVKYAGMTLLIDPVLTQITDKAGAPRTYFAPPFAPDANFPCDAVFCTHNHLDHLHPETLARLTASHPQVKVFLPAGVEDEVADTIASYKEHVTFIRDGETVTLADNLSVGAVAACHDTYRTDARGYEKALGYVIAAGPYRFFHAGDTLATERLIADVTACGTMDIAFLPINGRDWMREADNIIGNMTPQEAALFAERIGARMVIPTHYDMMHDNTENPLVFSMYMRDVSPARPLHFLKPGEPFVYWRNAT